VRWYFDLGSNVDSFSQCCGCRGLPFESRWLLLGTGYHRSMKSVVCFLLAMASCATAGPYEKTMSRLARNASRADPSFALDVSRSASAEFVDRLRAWMQGEPPKLEFPAGPLCVRAYWSDGYTIKFSVYVYFAMEQGKLVVVNAVADDSSFGDAFGRVFAFTEREPRPSEYDKCERTNKKTLSQDRHD
jgi:hypothetical protein